MPGPAALNIDQPASPPVLEVPSLPTASLAQSPTEGPPVAQTFPSAPGPGDPEAPLAGFKLKLGGNLRVPALMQSPWEWRCSRWDSIACLGSIAVPAASAAAPSPAAVQPQTGMWRAEVPDSTGTSPQQLTEPHLAQTPILVSTQPPELVLLLSGAPGLPAAQQVELSAADLESTQSVFSAPAAAPEGHGQTILHSLVFSQPREPAAASPAASPWQGPTGSVTPAPAPTWAGRSAQLWPWRLTVGHGMAASHIPEALHQPQLCQKSLRQILHRDPAVSVSVQYGSSFLLRHQQLLLLSLSL